VWFDLVFPLASAIVTGIKPDVRQAWEFLRLLCLKTPRAFSVAYVRTPADRPSAIERKAPTEAEAQVQMLLYLIENKLFTP
jgi:hypothetical protein